MSALALFLILLKASLTSFSGLAAIPIVREELVIQHHVLTDTQLNQAVVISRSTPGPVAIYLVSVGYFVDGYEGALVGWLAMILPSFLVIPLIHFLGQRAEHPRVKSILSSVIIASATLLFAQAIPLAKDAIDGYLTFTIAIFSFLILLLTKIKTHWVIFAALLISAVSVIVSL
jgi:chromate transporter